MRLVERYDSANLTELVVYEPRTHLAIALKVQEDPEVGQGPDKVGDVICLGGLERSTSRIPVIASSLIGLAARFPFVPLQLSNKWLPYLRRD